MKAIVKGFVGWTLGLAVLFGSPAVSMAARDGEGRDEDIGIENDPHA